MCGVVGIIGTQDAAREAFLGLTTLQHRGQDGAGILSYDHEGFHRVKSLGLVESVFTRENMTSLTGSLAIGHNRYSTAGKGDLTEIQPFILSYPYGLGMVHNGNIVNYAELATDLKQRSKRNFISQSDTEVVLNYFAEELTQILRGNTSVPLAFEQLCTVLEKLFTNVNGSYSIVTMIADHGILAFRDPMGIRPLVWGQKPGVLKSGMAHMFASESVALNFNGYDRDIRNVEPGEVVFIDLDGKVHTKIIESQKKPARHCMFEWVYFASAESEIDGVPVYRARSNLGKSLARLVRNTLKQKGFEADLVTPVPDTSRTAAISLAEELVLPYRGCLIKNRYVKRTFILASEDKRQKAINLKLSPVKSEIEGRRIILVDDSIVRGTTSRKIIELVRKAGAKQVFFVSTCPPIQHPCYYGIDFPNGEELIAHKKTVAEIEKELGADALIYLDQKGLVQSLETENPCMACLDGKYPTEVSQAGSLFAKARMEQRRQHHLSEGSS